jgi:hypothetical protein
MLVALALDLGARNLLARPERRMARESADVNQRRMAFTQAKSMPHPYITAP